MARCRRTVAGFLGQCDRLLTGSGHGLQGDAEASDGPTAVKRMEYGGGRDRGGMKKRIQTKAMAVHRALFPGSFDPFTAGHLNILKRALTMFDEVIVAVGINQDKRGFFSMDQRLDIIAQATARMEGVRVIKYDNLTIDTCQELGVRHIVRGVRNMIDFETERSVADMNRRLDATVETIIIPTAQEFAHISSSAVRDILKHHGDTSLFLPEGVRLPHIDL